MSERYANGQPVGYSNRNLCDECGGDLGACECVDVRVSQPPIPNTPPPADAARKILPADASLLRDVANGMDHGQTLGDFSVLITAARLRALAAVLEQGERQLEYARFVLVANELLPTLGEWTEPVRVKVESDDGRVASLVFKREPPK